jgi:hypothetical protein
MLLFALVLQQILEHTQEVAPSVATLAIADDISLVGKVDELRAAFLALTGARGTASVGLRIQPLKCAITAGPPPASAALAADLGIKHSPEGITVCGTPIGTDAYVAATLGARADSIIAQIDKLKTLPVSLQAHFALLRSSLSMRMAHLMRTVPWGSLQESVARVESAITAAAVALFRVPTNGAQSLTAVQQLKLPLRHGGFGLREATSLVADAALVAGASKAQAAMKDGLDACKPFSSAMRPEMQQTFQRVHDVVAEECKWGPDARDLPSAFVEAQLPGAQKQVSRVEGDRLGAAFLDACDTSTVEGQRAAARIRSAACGPASAWLTALPTAPTLRLNDGEFLAAGRHLLGLGMNTVVDVPPCLCTSGDSTTPDHALSCKHNAGVASMRHDILVSTWRRAIHRAGCATSVEPPYNSLAAAGAQGVAGLRRGDILTVWPDGRVRVMDCVVTHPAAASFVHDAAEVAGSAAAKAELRKQRAFDEFGEGSAYDFIPLAVESFGRMGSAASRFLSELGDLAAGEGNRVSKAAFVRGVRRELSCALCKGNARMYYKSLSRIAVNVGSDFHAGCDAPQEDPGVD